MVLLSAFRVQCWAQQQFISLFFINSPIGGSITGCEVGVNDLQKGTHLSCMSFGGSYSPTRLCDCAVSQSITGLCLGHAELPECMQCAQVHYISKSVMESQTNWLCRSHLACGCARWRLNGGPGIAACNTLKTLVDRPRMF